MDRHSYSKYRTALNYVARPITSASSSRLGCYKMFHRYSPESSTCSLCRAVQWSVQAAS